MFAVSRTNQKMHLWVLGYLKTRMHNLIVPTTQGKGKGGVG